MGVPYTTESKVKQLINENVKTSSQDVVNIVNKAIEEGSIPIGKGEKGDKGDPGPAGPQGPVGPQGPKGEDGKDAGIPDLTSEEYFKRTSTKTLDDFYNEFGNQEVLLKIEAGNFNLKLNKNTFSFNCPNNTCIARVGKYEQDNEVRYSLLLKNNPSYALQNQPDNHIIFINIQNNAVFKRELELEGEVLTGHLLTNNKSTSFITVNKIRNEIKIQDVKNALTRLKNLIGYDVETLPLLTIFYKSSYEENATWYYEWNHRINFYATNAFHAEYNSQPYPYTLDITFENTDQEPVEKEITNLSKFPFYGDTGFPESCKYRPKAIYLKNVDSSQFSLGYETSGEFVQDNVLRLKYNYLKKLSLSTWIQDTTTRFYRDFNLNWNYAMGNDPEHPTDYGWTQFEQPDCLTPFTGEISKAEWLQIKTILNLYDVPFEFEPNTQIKYGFYSSGEEKSLSPFTYFQFDVSGPDFRSESFRDEGQTYHSLNERNKYIWPVNRWTLKQICSSVSDRLIAPPGLTSSPIWICFTDTSSGGDSPVVSGGSGKLYQYNFTLKTYDNGTNPEYDLEFLLYESNFERVKSVAQGLGFTLNEPQDIATYINSLSETEPTTANQQITAFLLFSALVDKVNVNISGAKEELFPSVFSIGLFGPEGQSPRIVLGDDTTTPVTFYGLNTNSSCILTEYGTSSGGGTSSEPLVSIKMTNIDAKTNDSETEKLVDVQLYCTKSRWDSFVSLVKQAISLDITYDNFPTLFKQFNLQQQAFVFGYLLMDYFEGKVLPQSFVGSKEQNVLKDIQFINGAWTGTQDNITIAAEVFWSNNIYRTELPSADRGVDSGAVPYTTDSTVITVEEIAGPAIGASGGNVVGGQSLDKIRLTTTVQDATIYLDFYFPAGELVKDKDTLNAGIQSINTQAGTSIPLFSDLNSLSSILTYVNSNISVDNIYDSIFAGLFSWFTDHLISTRAYVGGMSLNIDIPMANANTAFYNLIVNEQAQLSVEGTDYMYQNPWIICSSAAHSKYSAISVETYGSSGGSGSSESSYTFAKGTLTVASESFSEDPYIYLGVSLTNEQKTALVDSKSLKLKLDFDTDSQMFSYRTLIFNVISSIKDADGDYVGQTSVGMTGVEPFAYIRIHNNNNSFVLEVHTENQQVHDQLVQGFNTFLSTLSAVIYYN